MLRPTAKIRTSLPLYCAIVVSSLLPIRASAQVASASNSLDFGTVAIRASSVGQTLAFRFNTATALAAVRTGSANRGGLDFRTAGGTCASGASYAAGQECTVAVIFSPSHVGDSHGAVTLLDSSGHIAGTGFVHGTGGGPRLFFPPGSSELVANGDNIEDLTEDSAGYVYGVRQDGAAWSVYAISPDTQVGRFYRQTERINALALDGARNLYLGMEGKVRRVATDGTTTDFAIPHPGALAIDGSGTVYVGDLQSIDRITTAGAVIPGSPIVGDSPYTGIVAMIAKEDGILQFSVSTGAENHGLGYRGKIYAYPPPSGISSPAYSVPIYDGGNVSFAGLSLQASGTIVAALEYPAVTGFNPGGPTVPPGITPPKVTLFSGFSLAQNTAGDLYLPQPNGSLLRQTTASPGGLAFVAGTDGETVTQTIAITNSGNQPLLFDADRTKIIGANATSFQIESTTCNVEQGILPGATCTETVIFRANQSGTQTAFLNLYTNDPVEDGNPVQVVLLGINP